MFRLTDTFSCSSCEMKETLEHALWDYSWHLRNHLALIRALPSANVWTFSALRRCVVVRGLYSKHYSATWRKRVYKANAGPFLRKRQREITTSYQRCFYAIFMPANIYQKYLFVEIKRMEWGCLSILGSGSWLGLSISGN